MKMLLHLMMFALIPFITCAQGVQGIDEIAPYSEGLAAVRKGNQWGFINTGGDLVIDLMILANNLLAVRSPENKWTLLKVEL